MAIRKNYVVQLYQLVQSKENPEIPEALMELFFFEDMKSALECFSDTAETLLQPFSYDVKIFNRKSPCGSSLNIFLQNGHLSLIKLIE